MKEEKLVCKFCRRDILEGQRRYFSRQAGMKGHYHWQCFVEACRQANRVGAQEIESIVVSAGIYDNFHTSDRADD